MDPFRVSTYDGRFEGQKGPSAASRQGKNMGSMSDDPDPAAAQQIEKVLGYLNFSSGASDPQFLRSLDTFFAAESLESAPTKGSQSAEPTWRRVWSRLRKALGRLEKDSPAFADATQARQVIDWVLEFCPRYAAHHADLLSHQAEELLFNSFFTGRVAEVLLRLLSESTDPDQIQQTALSRLNDYVGYRPVATLASKKIEPYEHEWIRPIPLYVQGAGVAAGKYQRVLEVCVELLSQTDDALLRAAYFDPEKMAELAIDPRAYDFDHPASRRPKSSIRNVGSTLY